MDVNFKTFRTTTFVTVCAVFAAFSLTESISKEAPAPGEVGAAREVVVDCNKERQKKVELQPNEGSAVFVFANCMCTERGEALKSRLELLIKNYQLVASGQRPLGQFLPLPSPTRTRMKKAEAQRHRTTLTVAPGKTVNTTIYCYPRSLVRAIHKWGASIKPIPRKKK